MVFAPSSVFRDFLSWCLEVLLKELALFFGLHIFLNIGVGEMSILNGIFF